MSIEAEALHFQVSGNVSFGGDLDTRTVSFGKLMRSSATASVCETVCRVRERVGDESNRSLVALRISTRAESGRRNQKGFIEGVWRRMHVPASTLKESVVVVARMSSSSANGAVEGATWT